MTEQTEGLTAEQREDEAGIEYTYVSGPEWGTLYSDGTAQELERLKRENQALRSIIRKQEEIIAAVGEYMQLVEQGGKILIDGANTIGAMLRGEGPK